MSQVQLFGFNN